MTQTERILDYLVQHGSIDAMQAWVDCGSWRCAARINEIRNAGYQIETRTKLIYNRYGEPCHVAEYILVVL